MASLARFYDENIATLKSALAWPNSETKPAMKPALFRLPTHALSLTAQFPLDGSAVRESNWKQSL